MTPDWDLKLILPRGERSLRKQIGKQLLSIELTDQRGLDNDTVTIEINDDEKNISIPPAGAQIDVYLGWQGKTLVNKGTFTIEEPEYSCPPRRLTLRGNATHVAGKLGEKNEKSWHDVSLADIASTLAKRHNLILRLNSTLGSIHYAHVDQTSESDVSFLSRLCTNLDAICTVKANNLLIHPRALAQTVSGKSLPVFPLKESQCTDWRWAQPKREQKTAVKAYWQDVNAAQRKSITVGDASGTTETLRITYANETEAKQAATAELKRQKRCGEFSVTLQHGQPELIPETPVKASDFKQQIDEADWIVTQVVHTLGTGGYVNSVDMELRE